VEANADLLAGFEGDGPDVHVLAETLAPKEFHRDLTKLVRAVRDVDEENAGAPQKPKIVLTHAEDKKLFFSSFQKARIPSNTPVP
jgi:hypothetical protein